MSKITWTWKKIVTIICGLLGIGTLTSCYGMPGGFEPEYSDLDEISNVSGYAYDDVNENDEFDKDENSNEGIPGIKVTVYDPAYSRDEAENEEDWLDKNTVLGTAITDEEGYFSIDLEEIQSSYDFIYKLEDIDGEEKGSYKTKITEEWYQTDFKMIKTDDTDKSK